MPCPGSHTTYSVRRHCFPPPPLRLRLLRPRRRRRWILSRVSSRHSELAASVPGRPNDMVMSFVRVDSHWNFLFRFSFTALLRIAGYV